MAHCPCILLNNNNNHIYIALWVVTSEALETSKVLMNGFCPQTSRRTSSQMFGRPPPIRCVTVYSREAFHTRPSMLARSIQYGPPEQQRSRRTQTASLIDVFMSLERGKRESNPPSPRPRREKRLSAAAAAAAETGRHDTVSVSRARSSRLSGNWIRLDYFPELR